MVLLEVLKKDELVVFFGINDLYIVKFSLECVNWIFINYELFYGFEGEYCIKGCVYLLMGFILGMELDEDD